MMVITFHNRGTGKSSRPNFPYSMGMFIDDIISLLNHLGIRDKIHLAGISMGGMIAQELAIKYPEKVKTLILCATSPLHIGTSIIETQKMMEHFSWEHKFKVRVGALYGRAFRRNLKEDKILYKQLEQDFIEDGTELKDWINQGAAITMYDRREHLYKIKQPTLILAGDEDSIINAKYSQILHDKIPQSTLMIIPNAGHHFVAEDPEKINEIIWNFIKPNLD
jgi:pimeloyl-ACP methyl ester carboxylesterase